MYIYYKDFALPILLCITIIHILSTSYSAFIVTVCLA